MAKVWCAEIGCKYNQKNKCTAKRINLSAGHIHTVHEGLKHYWTCRDYEQSDEEREILEALVKALQEERNKGNESSFG